MLYFMEEVHKGRFSCCELRPSNASNQHQSGAWLENQHTTHSHGDARVLCKNDDEWQNLTRCRAKTTYQLSPKFCIGDYVLEACQPAKFYPDQIRDFFSLHDFMQPFVYLAIFVFFLFLRSPIAKMPARILMQNMSKT